MPRVAPGLGDGQAQQRGKQAASGAGWSTIQNDPRGPRSLARGNRLPGITDAQSGEWARGSRTLCSQRGIRDWILATFRLTTNPSCRSACPHGSNLVLF